MMQADPTRPSPRPIASARKTSPLALAVFAVAYIGAMVIIFAPAGSFVSTPNAAHSGR